MNILKIGIGRFSAAAVALSIAASAFAAEENKVLGVHEVLDPDAITDDFGITAPVPISHPGRRYPSTDDFPTGPDIGESLPDFTLTNQHGEAVNFNEDRDGSRAVVVFFRSVVW